MEEAQLVKISQITPETDTSKVLVKCEFFLKREKKREIWGLEGL
jgi:hypothetical protein